MSKNDVNAALLGELKLHQYQAERIFCMTLGTGIGGAYKNNQSHIDNGELHKANEVGYLLYRPTEIQRLSNVLNECIEKSA